MTTSWSAPPGPRAGSPAESRRSPDPSRPLERAGRQSGSRAAVSQLVAVPGLGLGQETWRPALALLAGSDGVVEALPGYGLPVARCGARPPDQLAEYLCRHLTRPVTLLGHSSSCQVVAHAANLHPELVERIVLVAPTTDPRAGSWASLAGLWLRNAAHEDARQVPALLRQYRNTGLRSMVATMDAARHDDIRTTLAQVRCPVVLVRGRDDRIVRADWLAALAASGPDRTVVEIPAGAHMVPLTHPDTFAHHVAPALR
jgi:pimeloyl-ACP methyl ester carboxylesterase